MKNVLCFNAHAYNNYIIFEFSRDRRGIGILCTETLEVKEIDSMGSNILLGGMWENYIILRRGYDIILFDVDKNKEKLIASCHHIAGLPAIGHGYCSWIQLYKEKSCIALYDIEKNSSFIFTPRNCVSKVYLINHYMVYQSCSKNKCNIFAYNICTGELKKCFESSDWVELYVGRDNTLVWTVRRGKGEYIFDIYVYNIYNSKTVKVLSDYRNAVIPTVSNGLLLWVDGNIEGDSVYIMPIDT